MSDYFEYNSTIMCSSIGIVMSSRFGSARTFPVIEFASTSNQAGIVWLISKALRI